MYLFKNGSKYYLAKNNNKYHGWDGDTYVIKDGRLVWANPNIYLRHTSESAWTTPITINDILHIYEDELSVTFKKISELGGNTNQGPLYGGTDGEWGFSISRWWTGINNKHGNSYVTADVKHTMVLKNYEAYLNGTSLNLPEGSHSGISENPKNVRIFYSVNGALQGDIYNIKWERNNILIHHFVPVPKGLLIGNFVVPSNGMFDIIEQKFYPNVGTGEFTIGGIPEDYIIDNGKLIWRRDDIYLESSGTQYIDTGIKSNSELEVRLKWYQQSGQVFGNLETSNNVNKSFGYDSSSSGGYFRVGSGFVSPSGTYNIPGWHVITGNKTTFIRDNITFTLQGSSFSDSNNNINLFRYRGGSTYLTGKVSYFQLYNTGILIQYLVPVPKDMVIGSYTVPSNGMFDLVTQTFFENKGTGTFIYGKDE